MLVEHDVVDVDAGAANHRRVDRKAAALPRVQIEDLVAAARHLSERDRALVRAVYERGLPLKAVAAATEVRAGRLHRRLRSVLQRMRSPLFRTTLREAPNWSHVRREIAQGVILAGRSQRAVAAALGVSLHRVRVELEHIKALAGIAASDMPEP